MKQPVRQNKKKRIELACLFMLLALGAAGVYFYFSYDLPRIASLEDYRPPLASRVYSLQGELIGEFFIERRYFVTLREISPLLVKAIIAAEDDQFFKHRGIDLWSILRAALKNLSSFEIRQGGSTITQQIVKSMLLTPERSFSRKIKEAILARRIENSLSKEDILTVYLNQIYFGRGAYGVEAAARVYFGTSASEVSLAQLALLAGVIKAPNYYSPVRNPQGARQRQEYVLSRMVEQGYITPAERAEAEEVVLTFAVPENVSLSKAPYFVEHIRKNLEARFGAEYLYTEGLRIETGLDSAMQAGAQQAVAAGIAAYERRNRQTDPANRVQSALIAIDPFCGYVKALVGGRDFQASQFDRAIQARRQPGSAFKPVIYASALDKGYTPASIIIDAPLITFEGLGQAGRERFWEPQNYDLQYLGPTTLRKALTHSRNIVTLKILQDIGIGYVIRYAEQMGINGEFSHDLTLGLGTCGVSLLDLVKAYGAFSAGGVCAEPMFITRIKDRDGHVVAEYQPRLSPALSPQTAYIMTSMLQSVVEEGTGRKVRALKRPCAGKTGTTNDVRDAWFIGFTPQLVAGIWVGFDNLQPLGRKETGAVAASPIWLDFMQAALEQEPIEPFKVPEGIVFVKINPETGFYPGSPQEEAVFECFKEGTLPTPYAEAAAEQPGL
jgi:penicillin-binding protein 1A